MSALTARYRAIAGALHPSEWARLGVMALVILALNGFGWGIFFSWMVLRRYRFCGRAWERGLCEWAIGSCNTQTRGRGRCGGIRNVGIKFGVLI